MIDKKLFYLSGGIPEPECVHLRAGDLKVDFVDGALRDFRVNGQEVLRMVYAAVRDANWGTVPFTLSDVTIDARERAFDISFTSEHRQGDIHFVWRATIAGSENGEITFDFDGEAKTTFARNRIGFCVLHPGSFGNVPCQIEHTDGQITDGAFPASISPHQPFFAVRGITSDQGGVRVEMRMEGDTFEMEDQRNWTDDSFKTYCTPLGVPFPVIVEAGTRVQQRVSIKLIAVDGLEDAASSYELIERPMSGDWHVGLSVANADSVLNVREIERLQALKLHHLRVELDLTDSMWLENLRDADVQAVQFKCKLEIVVFVSDDAEKQLILLAEAAAKLQAPISHWIVFHHNEKVTAAHWVKAAKTVLHPFNAPIGAGTPYYFTELNRERPPENADFNVYSINPQVHAFDNASLVETLAMHDKTARDARFNGKPVVVSPITLKPRGNPDATTSNISSAPNVLPPTVDPRQMSLFGAVWTFASIVHLGAAEVESATYYETVGWRGIMERETGSPLPDLFPSIAGGVFPMYHVFADIGEFASEKVWILRRLDDSLSIGLASEGERTILLANLTPDTQAVMIDLNEAPYHIRVLDETTVEFAMREPEAWRAQKSDTIYTMHDTLTLSPYAYVRLDKVDE
ncbi:MAG: hypothetical protein SGI73_19110 [Chloroflexota bacterium]|nr:hypothetical protein [Chloroflexota bacterium]